MVFITDFRPFSDRFLPSAEMSSDDANSTDALPIPLAGAERKDAVIPQEVKWALATTYGSC